MKVTPTRLEGVVVIEPQRFGDTRGFFMECWKSSAYQDAGVPDQLPQSNVSRSEHGVLRGLHYQYPEPQGKLVTVLDGAVYDVAVDIRRGSPQFGAWVGVELSAENARQLWVPEGFAHGFCVTGEHALVHYMCSREFAPQHDAAVAWNDPALGIDWPLEACSLSDKDANAPRLDQVPVQALPPYAP
ncbi:MAG: dTDP-4-dehydrorhamnose 3,5-epimerase [Xanthomonadales bacterium]|nr:dTDP-4-dehydrorhamnose 3,5-epimerase [Xanthomonadales bacterium]